MRLTQFTDVKQVLDAALASSGGVYTLPTRNAAIHWRQRAYKFRKALHEQTGETRYDALVLRRIEPGSCDVKIDLVRPAGLFTPSNPTAAVPASDLTSIAAELARKIDEGGIV